MSKLGAYTVNEPIKCRNNLLGPQMCTKWVLILNN